MTQLAGSHVLVTGGSQGIGAAFARLAASSGATVSLIARDEATLRATAEPIGALWRSADVTDAAALGVAIDELEAAAAPVDVLVCCAGFALPGRFLEVPADEFDRQYAVNFGGAVAAVRHVLPGMIARGRGHIALTSSTAGLLGVVGYTGYAPTKWAIRGFADSLRYEVEPQGVKLSVLYPPDTDTPGFAKENTRKPPETVAISGSIKPVAPEKVAAALARGIERNRDNITADFLSSVLVRFGGGLEPLLRGSFRRTIAKALDGGM